MDAPIFVADAILDRVGVLPGAEQEARLSMFREFVNSLEVDLGGGSDMGGPDREAQGPA